MLEGRDAADELAGYRNLFNLPDGIIYLDGNSLGPLPKATANRLNQIVVHEWGDGLIRSWNDADWIGAPRRVGGKIARLIGANEDEIVVADSTSVNLFKLVTASLSLDGKRRNIITELGNFPTDHYILQGIQDLLPKRVRIIAVERSQVYDASMATRFCLRSLMFTTKPAKCLTCTA